MSAFDQATLDAIRVASDLLRFRSKEERVVVVRDEIWCQKCWMVLYPTRDAIADHSCPRADAEKEAADGLDRAWNYLNQSVAAPSPSTSPKEP